MITGPAPQTLLPQALYRAEQVRELDRVAIETYGVDGFELMQRAGRSAFRQLLRRWPLCRRLLVLCGGGNNGGDGYVVAALARQKGLTVNCLALSDPGKLKGAAHEALEMARRQDLEPLLAGSLDSAELDNLIGEADVIVDALLGTGLGGEVRDPYAGLIRRVAEAGRPTLAIDIPSGLCADTGRSLGCVLPATVTVTFIGLKLGLLTGQGPDYTGELHFDDLGVDPGVYEGQTPVAMRRDWAAASAELSPRRRSSHKGDFGRVLIIGGDTGMGGAGLLAADAALRGGAGLVFLASRPEHVGPAIMRRPEIQARGVSHRNDLEPLLETVDVVVIGPGLGRSAWGEQLLERALGWQGPLVLDADALNGLATMASPPRRDDWVLTPHPGEAARLLGESTGAIGNDRLDAVSRLQARYGGTVLLKGAGTLVAGPDQVPAVLTDGNPGMASAGMGDVLSGLIGALLGQSLPPFMAACLGASLHGAAADQAVMERGEPGLLAGDVIEWVPRLWASLDAHRREAVE